MPEQGMTVFLLFVQFVYFVVIILSPFFRETGLHREISVHTDTIHESYFHWGTGYRIFAAVIPIRSQTHNTAILESLRITVFLPHTGQFRPQDCPPC
jgi:hypothetical protein